MDPGLARSCLQEAIRGKIGDPHDGPVPSARVVLSGSRLARRIATVTGSGGCFMFHPVPPGVYTLEVACAGFGRLVQRGITVQEHAITGLDLKMDFREDSRSLKLRALSLEYIVDRPERKAAPSMPPPACQLRAALAGLRLDRALFNPPPAARVGRSFPLEFGLYQNLKEALRRRLRENRPGSDGDADLTVALRADLRAAGCLVLPRSLPRQQVDGARYLDWRWEVLPRSPGNVVLRLELSISADGDGLGQEERSLLAIDRELLIRGDRWLSLKRGLKQALRREGHAAHSDR